MNGALDEIDILLLAKLQQDASLSVKELADHVKLSPTPCWRRIKRLEHEGYISARVALVDPVRINLPITAFLAITLDHHSKAHVQSLLAFLNAAPEAVETHQTNGVADFHVRLMLPNVDAYNAFYDRLVASAPGLHVTCSFVLKTHKSSTALPLNYVSEKLARPLPRRS